MKDDIVEKLRAVLATGINSECKVVYLLCECRKLMDKYPPEHPPLSLKLYCHWALHVDLTGRDTVLPLLQAIDTFAASILAGSKYPGFENHIFREFLYLDSFRRELGALLAAYELPTDLTDVDGEWDTFITHYSGVIQDGSLSCRARAPELRTIESVTFNGRRPSRQGNVEASWVVALKSGRSLSVDVKAGVFPNGEHLMIHGVRFR